MKILEPIFIRDPALPHPLGNIKIPNFKRRLKTHAKSHPKIYKIDINRFFCWDNERHLELLQIFDQSGGNIDNIDFSKTLYWKYRADRKAEWAARNQQRIQEVFALYKNIKENGCLIEPIVSGCGYLIEGMHRLSILIHLNYTKASINFVKYSDCFSKKESRKIKLGMINYRNTHGIHYD